MLQAGPVVLLTRPREGSERFGSALKAACDLPFTIAISPLLGIEPMSDLTDLFGYSAVIFTSAHAVDAVSNSEKAFGLTAYCVGERTRRKATEAGFTAINGGGTAEALLEKIVEAKPRGRVLHIRGVHAQGEITERLQSRGLVAEEAVVYDQVELPFDPETVALLQSSAKLIVPVFSARTARLLSARFSDVPSKPYVVAISDAVAHSWDAAARTVRVLGST